MFSAVTKQNQIPPMSEQNFEAFGRKIGLAGFLFGCRHNNLSRPFTYGENSYRVCLQCGARRHFDPETLTTFGAFYYPPKPICPN